MPDLWRPGSVKIKRYYAKNGRLILAAKRGKEIKQIHCTIHCNSSNRYIVIQIQIHALCKYIVFILISLLFYFFSSLRRGDQSTVFCIVSFSRHSPAHCNNLVIKLVYNTLCSLLIVGSITTQRAQVRLDYQPLSEQGALATSPPRGREEHGLDSREQRKSRLRSRPSPSQRLEGHFLGGKNPPRLRMLAQGCVKSDVCQIHSIERPHSPNTADFYNEPTKKNFERHVRTSAQQRGRARDL